LAQQVVLLEQLESLELLAQFLALLRLLEVLLGPLLYPLERLLYLVLVLVLCL
jgi:hypothetical protein